jgi:UDP-glucose 4-epimerase
MTMKILMTGGAGFIGHHLVKRLSQAGYEVHVFDIKPLNIMPECSASLRMTVGSILDERLVDSMVREADMVIHLAGIAEPQRYVTQPKATMSVNLRGSLTVVDSAVLHQIPIIFASTSEVYGRNPSVPWSETADRVLGKVQDSRWCYSSSKAAVEHYLHACRQEDGLDFVTVRLFNVYGPGLTGRVISNFIERALTGESLEVHGDGSQVRCFVYVRDVVDAVEKILHSQKFAGETYNIGNPAPVTILGLARLIIELSGSRSPARLVPYDALQPGYVDIPKRIPCIDRIRDEIGWLPTTDLRSGLLTVIRHAQQGMSASM